MALKIVLLALLVCCAASEAQGQGDSLPLVYNPRTVVNDIGQDGCPIEEVRDDIKERFDFDIRADLHDIVFPSILLSQGWTRVVKLDMTNASHSCPFGWRTYTSPTRACGRNTGSGTCQSAYFPTNGVRYSHVCGRVTAYQYCQTRAFYAYNIYSTRTIDDVYLDGISITHGNPREHVWSFASALYESYASTGDWTCPCTNTNNNNNPNILIPPFVGDDYFCDTGSVSSSSCIFRDDNPLWDGEGCGPTSTCCEFSNPPWFCKTLPLSQPVTDDIEVRICGLSSTSSTDVPIELIELFVL